MKTKSIPHHGRGVNDFMTAHADKALLRAHGLIARLGKTHRYKVTKKGRILITAFLAAAQADTEQLTKLAA